MHELPKLNYDYNALEPYIDEETMRIHHTKHHQTYVDKLNEALQKHPELLKMPLWDLLKKIKEVPEDIRQAVINHGGGHYNHTMFWNIMAPNAGGQPSGKLRDDINKTFGSFDKFKEEFTKTALGVFGSGWAWLVVENGHLKIVSTGKQDSPLMNNQIPVLCLDVWEHAYYLKHRQKRADYIASWWNVVNWKEVERIYSHL